MSTAYEPVKNKHFSGRTMSQFNHQQEERKIDNRGSKCKKKKGRPYFLLKFKPKRENPKTKTRTDTERKILAIIDIIPVYPKIVITIPKKKKYIEKFWSLTSAAKLMDDMFERGRPIKEYEYKQPFDTLRPSFKP